MLPGGLRSAQQNRETKRIYTMKIVLLSTPLTRLMTLNDLDRLGVNAYRPIFSHKTNQILGYPMTGKPAVKMNATPKRAGM